MMGFGECEGCRRRRGEIAAAWDFGAFFWDTLSNVLGALLVGLPVIAWLFARVNARVA